MAKVNYVARNKYGYQVRWNWYETMDKDKEQKQILITENMRIGQGGGEDNKKQELQRREENWDG